MVSSIPRRRVVLLALGVLCGWMIGFAAARAEASPRSAASAASAPAPSAPAPSAAALALPGKQECVYSDHHISLLDAFSTMVGRRLSCAQVYSNAATNWHDWEHPWFVNYVNAPNLDWSAWATAPDRARRLVVTLDFFPSALDRSDWLDAGAAGAYVRHDRALAANLVAAGLGHAIIRLAPEMNGNWYPYSLGAGPSQWNRWKRLWIRTVAAMRSVPGAHFAFDWCVNVRYRDLPLSAIYPGDRSVDIVGMDVYDVGPLPVAPAARWHTIATEPEGVNAIVSFARRENRPLSIPEWGIAPRIYGGDGDDPTFINGIASVVAQNPVVYESYFDNEDYATELSGAPRSLAAYRRHFGGHGDSVGRGSDRW